MRTESVLEDIILEELGLVDRLANEVFLLAKEIESSVQSEATSNLFSSK